MFLVLATTTTTTTIPTTTTTTTATIAEESEWGYVVVVVTVVVVVVISWSCQGKWECNVPVQACRRPESFLRKLQTLSRRTETTLTLHVLKPNPDSVVLT